MSSLIGMCGTSVTLRASTVKVYHPAMLRRFLVPIAALVLAGLVPNAYAQQGPSNVLFYTHPAREWNQALPLGNGRLGAMVFGNVNGERIQLNENSLWMGGPRDTNNPDAIEASCRSAPSAVRRNARRGLCGRREVFDGAARSGSSRTSRSATCA